MFRFTGKISEPKVSSTILSDENVTGKVTKKEIKFVPKVIDTKHVASDQLTDTIANAHGLGYQVHVESLKRPRFFGISLAGLSMPDYKVEILKYVEESE